MTFFPQEGIGYGGGGFEENKFSHTFLHYDDGAFHSVRANQMSLPVRVYALGFDENAANPVRIQFHITGFRTL